MHQFNRGSRILRPGLLVQVFDTPAQLFQRLPANTIGFITVVRILEGDDGAMLEVKFVHRAAEVCVQIVRKTAIIDGALNAKLKPRSEERRVGKECRERWWA